MWGRWRRLTHPHASPLPAAADIPSHLAKEPSLYGLVDPFVDDLSPNLGIERLRLKPGQPVMVLFVGVACQAGRHQIASVGGAAFGLGYDVIEGCRTAQVLIAVRALVIPPEQDLVTEPELRLLPRDQLRLRNLVIHLAPGVGERHPARCR